MKKFINILLMFIFCLFLVGCNSKVEFDSKGGSEIIEIRIENNKIVKPNDPVKEGYDFIEWTLNGTTYDFDSEIDGKVKLEARWSKKGESTLENAKNSLKNIYYINYRNDLNLVYDNCKFEIVDEKYKKIIRDITNQEVNIKYNLFCNNEIEKITIKAIIKESPYKYKVKSNENMQNYDLEVISNTKLNGTIYSYSGEYLSDLIDSKAIINNNDIKKNPKFKMLLNDDKNTIYVLLKNK